MLVCPNILLTDSMGTPLDRDIGGKCVPGEVEGQVLFDTANIGNFFQITVQFLIRQHGEKFAVTIGLATIFCNDALGYIE